MTGNSSKLSLARDYFGKLFPRSLPPRLLLIFFAIIIQIGGEVLSWYAKNTGNPIVISFAVILWLFWFGLVFLIAKPSIDDTLRPYRKILHLAAVVIVVILSLMAVGEAIGLHLVNIGVVKDNAMATTLTESLSYNDATALNQQASQTLLEIEGAVLILALVWYYYNRRKYPQAGLLLAVLPLFFAWRSFSCYFYFASLLVFGAVIIEGYRKPAAGKQPQLVSADHLSKVRNV